MYLVPQKQARKSECAWCVVHKNPRLLGSSSTKKMEQIARDIIQRKPHVKFCAFTYYNT